ncbi:MAG TPA: MFS transporter [Casimicrobiaceae bacterium]|nr:MFS transporter [Casimicrobiaceae bacterium]
MDTAIRHSFRRDAHVIALVATAHSLSHFLQLALPPLFPLLRAEFDVSWTLLGALVGTFYVASGITQFAAGFAVDRVGARQVLLAGMSLVVGGTLLAALSPGAAWLFPAAAMMGVGNGVFHPADFAILNASVDPKRLGYAYSMHGVGGNLGYALAPIVSYGLGAAFGWRVALVAMGLIGLVVLGVLATQRAMLDSQRAHDAHTHTVRGSVELFLRPAILLCFLYFIVQTTASVGLQTFLPAALNAGLDVPLVLATSAVTAYLLGGAAGIVAGGFLAVRTTRHDRVAGVGLFAGATLVALVATGAIPRAFIVPLFVVVGIVLGATGPSRDLIVRNATPKGAAGRVYGFVYSGLDLGATLGPVWFGLMLDHQLGREMFYAIAALFVIAIGTVVNVRRAATARA